MGASQSTEETVEVQNEMVSESLYDILEVEKTATEAELKKAYKKQALLLHPDRNYENPEEATTKFAKVQAAYDVLSDPQERAWYDTHGLNSNGRPAEPEYGGKVTSLEELKRYLDPGFYQQIDVKSSYFYETIESLFKQLAQEEEEAALDAGIDAPILPRFGYIGSDWSTVTKPFYDSWQSFSSVKSFSWEDVYRTWDAPDRRSRRAMETHNKRVRDAAKREFNQLVRTLVAIVKQKDTRVKQNNKIKQAMPADAGSKEQARRDKEARKAKLQSYKAQDWEKVDSLVVDGEGAESGEEVVELFECIVCEKSFKARKQLKMHEKSKKHMKRLKELQREMRREGIQLGFDDDDSDQEINKDSESDSSDRDNGKESANNVEKEVEEDVEVESESKSELGGSNDHGDNEQNEGRDHPEEKEEEEEQESQQDKDKDQSLDDLLAQLEGTRLSRNNRSLEAKVNGRAKQRKTKKEKANVDFAIKCTVCQTEFPTRNKLFEHLKVSKHASNYK